MDFSVYVNGSFGINCIENPLKRDVEHIVNVYHSKKVLVDAVCDCTYSSNLLRLILIRLFKTTSSTNLYVEDEENYVLDGCNCFIYFMGSVLNVMAVNLDFENI